MSRILVLSGILAWMALTGLSAWAQAPAAPRIQSILMLPDKAGPQDQVEGLVTLTGPAPEGGVYVQLTGSTTIWIPGTVVVPAGRNNATFAVVVNRSAQDGEAVVVGLLQGQRVPSNKLSTLADPDMANQAGRAAAPPLADSDGYPASVFSSYPYSYPSAYPYPYPYYYPYPSPYGPPHPVWPPRPGPPVPPRPVYPVPATPTIQQPIIPSQWDWRPSGVRR